MGPFGVDVAMWQIYAWLAFMAVGISAFVYFAIGGWSLRGRAAIVLVAAAATLIVLMVIAAVALSLPASLMGGPPCPADGCYSRIL